MYNMNRLKPNYLYNHPLFTQFIKNIGLFLSAMVFMNAIGDAVAWYRMPKYDSVAEWHDHILDDVGFEQIPYYCPYYGRHNIQTWVIFISFVYNSIVVGISCWRNKPWFGNQSATPIRRPVQIGRPAIHFLQHTAILMMLRSFTMIVTAFPSPNPACKDESVSQLDYSGALVQTMSSFPAKSCGNQLFSGHTMFLTSFLIFEYKYNLVPRKMFFLSIIKTLIGYYSVIACRSHYSIDVLIAILFTFGIFIIHRVRGMNITTDFDISARDTDRMLVNIESLSVVPNMDRVDCFPNKTTLDGYYVDVDLNT
jgi:hypothetical protein